MGIWTKWARINGKYYQMTDDNIVRDGVRGVDWIVECKQQHLTIVKINSFCGVIDSDGKFIIHLSNYYCIWPFDNFFIAEHKCNPNTTEYHIYECDIYDIYGNLLIRNIDEIYSINQCGAILHNNKYDFNLLLTVIGDEAYLQIPERAYLGRYERGDSMEAYKEYAFPYKITDFQKDVVIFDYKNVFSRALFLRCGEQSRCYGRFAIIDSETAFCSNGLHLGLVSSKGYNVDCKYIAISKPLNGFVYAITEYGDRYLYGELLKWKLSNGQVIPDKSIELFNMLGIYRMLTETEFSLSSKKETEFIEHCVKPLGVEYDTQYYLKDLHHFCDVFIPSKNSIIEFQGDYWHGNPVKYSYEELSEYQRKKVNKDKELREYCSKNGINLIEVWESDYDKDYSAVKTLLEEQLK